MPNRLGPTSRDMVAVAEAATALLDRPTRTAVRETPTLIGPAATPGRFSICLIRAGWSLNGVYYSEDVLKRAANSGQWAAGSLNYVDHDTDAEEEQRPSGSLLRLASYQTADARWDDNEQGLVAEVRAFAPWREAVADWAASKAIGMSIRAWVYGQDGEAEGRKGFIVSEIVESRSCDYVTVPAAGGAILSVIESVRRGTSEAPNIGAWLESRLHLALTTYADDMYGGGQLTRDERIVLSTAIGDGLQAWSARVEADAPQLFQRSRWSYPEDATTAEESARRVAEATVEERRAALAHEIAGTYGDDETYTWVRDFDPDASLVWFDTCPSGDSSTWQQACTVTDDGTVTLDGDRVEVVPRTVYDPAPADDETADSAAEAVVEPAPPTAVAVEVDVTDGAPPTVTDPPTEEETGMSGTQTGAPPVQAGTAPVVDTPPTTPAVEAATAANAAVIAAMEAMTNRLATLTEGLAAVTARADASDAENQRLRNRNTAREAVAVALAAPEVPADLREQITPRVTAAVLAAVPTTDAGDVDLAALGEAITAAITAESGYAARLLESAGVGRPRGLGASAPKTQTVDEFVSSLAEGFEALGLSPAAAKIAAQGRG